MVRYHNKYYKFNFDLSQDKHINNTVSKAAL